MSQQLDTANVEAQINEAVEKAIIMLKTPICDEACEANKTLAALHTKLAAAQQQADDAELDLSTAKKNYFVAMKGDAEFTSERNNELNKSSKAAARSEINKLRKRLDALEFPIGAAVTIEDLTAQTGDVHSVYEGVLKEKQVDEQDKETKMLIDKQRASYSDELRDSFNGAINGWMKYAYFAVAAAFFIRLAFTGAYRSRSNIMKLAVVLLLPIVISPLVRWAQEYSPFGDTLTRRLRYLYVNGLQN